MDDFTGISNQRPVGKHKDNLYIESYADIPYEIASLGGQVKVRDLLIRYDRLPKSMPANFAWGFSGNRGGSQLEAAALLSRFEQIQLWYSIPDFSDRIRGGMIKPEDEGFEEAEYIHLGRMVKPEKDRLIERIISIADRWYGPHEANRLARLRPQELFKQTVEILMDVMDKQKCLVMLIHPVTLSINGVSRSLFCTTFRTTKKHCVAAVAPRYPDLKINFSWLIASVPTAIRACNLQTPGPHRTAHLHFPPHHSSLGLALCIPGRSNGAVKLLGVATGINTEHNHW